MLYASLIAVSLLTLAASFLIWRSTGSRSALLNGVFGSLALLIAARLVASHQQPEAAFGLPFFAAMLLLGRGAGTFFRRRDNSELRPVALMWLGVGSAVMICAAATYFSIVNS